MSQEPCKPIVVVISGPPIDGVFPSSHDGGDGVSIQVHTSQDYWAVMAQKERELRASITVEKTAEYINKLLKSLPKSAYAALGEEFLAFRRMPTKGVITTIHDGVMTLGGVPKDTPPYPGKRGEKWNITIDFYTLLSILQGAPTGSIPDRDPEEVVTALRKVRMLDSNYKPIGPPIIISKKVPSRTSVPKKKASRTKGVRLSVKRVSKKK